MGAGTDLPGDGVLPCLEGGGSWCSHPRLDGMTQRPRRPLVLASLLAMAALSVACNARDLGATPSATSAASVPAPTATDAAPPATAASASEAPTTSQSDTEWGRIWDALPAGFPLYPGGTAAEDAGIGPVSATYAIEGAEPDEIATWMQQALEMATFSTEALAGPLEDGRFVLDSVGDGDCRMQVEAIPQGGLTFIVIRYGAACPNS
jgi:uncharacterized membrane protein YjjB (DUF3815 family)